jgi:hypothetical protein
MKNRLLLSTLAGLSCVSAADNDELSRQATDPSATLIASNFQGTYIGGLPSRFSVNPQYNLRKDRGLEEWSAS